MGWSRDGSVNEVCEVDSRVDDGIVDVAVRGEVDIETSGVLADCLNDHIAAGRTTIRVSLRAVSFIDSTGIGVLVRAYKAIGDRGRISVVDVPDRIARTFRLVGLDTFIDVTELVPE